MSLVRIGTLLVLASSAFLTVGCPSPKPPPGDSAANAQPEATASTRPKRGKKLVIGVDQEPDKLSQVLNAQVVGTYIDTPIYGFFVKYDEKMNLIPDVLSEIPSVENGGITPDYLSYTYHLRKDVKWHDGVPLTVADVVFTVNTIMDPRIEVESRAGFDKVKSMDTPDDWTITFHLKEVYAPFLTDTFFDEAIWPKHLLEKEVGPTFGSANYHRAPVGLGPFKFKEWVTGSHVTIVRNEDYFRGVPDIEEITFKIIPNTESLLVALQAGEIDSYDNAGTDQYKKLKAMPNVNVNVTPMLMWEHIDMNHDDPILKDVRVRQAIQFAIDREQISKEIYEGLWPAAYGDTNPTLPWFNPKVNELVRFDQAASKALLDEAGWTLGPDGIRIKDGKKLTLSISTTAGRRQRELAEQVLQQQLRGVGIELVVKNYASTAFFAPYEQDGVMKRGKYQLGMYAWSSSPDPDRYNNYHSSQVPPPEGQNYPHYRSKATDEAIKKSQSTGDFATRKIYVDQIQELVATDVPMTPLIWRADIDPMDARVENFKPNPTQCGDTWNTWEWKLKE